MDTTSKFKENFQRKTLTVPSLAHCQQRPNDGGPKQSTSVAKILYIHISTTAPVFRSSTSIRVKAATVSSFPAIPPDETEPIIHNSTSTVRPMLLGVFIPVLVNKAAEMA